MTNEELTLWRRRRDQILFDDHMSGARDAFGVPFSEWHIVGWEEGNPPEFSVCWVDAQPAPVEQRPATPQLELFA